MLCSPLQSMWDLTIHPFMGQMSSLAHHLVSGSDTICNSLNPLDIVLFVFPFGLLLKVFKTRKLARDFHTLIRNILFPSPTTSRYCPIWVFPFGLPLKVFKTRLLARGFHTLIKNVSFLSPTDGDFKKQA